MTPARRSGTVIIIRVSVVFGALLVIAALELALLHGQSASATVLQVVTPNTEILITPVPTFGGIPSLVPSPLPTQTPAAVSPPTLQAGRGAATASDPFVAAPLSVQAAAPLLIPGPLVDPALGLRTGPVAVPLQIQIPALRINAPVLAVGLTLDNAMAAPRGIFRDDLLWQTVFWYRGGGIPGDAGTATFAGHYDDAIGRPAIFAYLGDLRISDLIIVRDERSGLEIPFIVTETKTYTDEEAADPAVLARIFGSSSVSDAETQSVSNQLSHLTLITCAGAWIDGSFNLRLVVYATRADYPF